MDCTLTNFKLNGIITVTDLKPDTIEDLKGEVYALKSKSIIPEIIDFDLEETKGKEIDSKDLADTLPGFWHKDIH